MNKTGLRLKLRLRALRSEGVQGLRLYLSVSLAAASAIAAQAAPSAQADSSIDLWKTVVTFLVIGSLGWVGAEIRSLQKARLDQMGSQAARELELEKRLGRIEHLVEDRYRGPEGGA